MTRCSHYRTCMLAIATTSLALASFTPASAQVEKKEAAEGAEKTPDQLKDQISEYLTDELREISQACLLIQVKEMQRVCGFDERTAKKMAIAAKGASDRYSRSMRVKIRQSMQRQEIPPNVEVRVGDRVVRKGPQENGQLKRDRFKRELLSTYEIEMRDRYMYLYHRRASGGRSGRGISGGGLYQLRQQPIWTKSVATNLTPAQRKQYALAGEDRRKRLQQAAVDYQLAQLEDTLRLNEDQRQQVSQLVAGVVKITTTDMRSIQYTVRSQVKQVADDRMQAVLSETQMKLWLDYKRSY